MWPDLIRKAKEGGLNVIETYVFWNAHEPERRKVVNFINKNNYTYVYYTLILVLIFIFIIFFIQYDFSGNLDLVRFIKTIKNEGLYALLRIGPYVCAEWSYG